jgi:hypothetical protein
MLAVDAVPQLYSVGPNWFEYSLVDEEFVVYRELRPRNQYTWARALPSCFRLAKKCLCQVSPLSRRCPRYFASSV